MEAHVRDVALHHDRSIFDALTARDHADLTGVARVRETAGARVRRDEPMVAVEPDRVRLGLGNEEALVDEALGGEIELAHRDGILAPAREADPRAVHVGLQDLGVLKDPVLAFVGRELVDVEQDLPIGRAALEALPGRAAPKPFAVRGILPKLVKVFVEGRGFRQAIIREQRGAQTFLQAGEGRVRSQANLAAGVAFAHPVERFLPADVFEPKKGIFEICHVGGV